MHTEYIRSIPNGCRKHMSTKQGREVGSAATQFDQPIQPHKAGQLQTRMDRSSNSNWKLHDEVTLPKRLTVRPPQEKPEVRRLGFSVSSYFQVRTVGFEKFILVICLNLFNHLASTVVGFILSNLSSPFAANSAAQSALSQSCLSNPQNQRISRGRGESQSKAGEFTTIARLRKCWYTNR